MRWSTCRSASEFVVHLDGSYSKTDDLRVGGYLAVAGAARAGGGERRPRYPGARRPARPPAQQRRPRPGTSPPAPPGSMATTMSASRSPASTACTASRSASRSIRRSRPRQVADRHSSRPGSTAAPRSTPAAASSIPSACAAAIPIIGTARSTRTARSARPSSTTAIEGRLEAVQIDPRRLGRRLRRAILSTASCETIGDEKSLPLNRTSQLGLFALENYDARPAPGRGRRALRASDGRRRCRRRSSAIPTLQPQLRRLFRLGRRQLRARRRCASASTSRTPSARRAPRSCSSTAPIPAPRRSRSAIPISPRRRSNGVELTLRGLGRRLQLRRVRLSRSGSTTIFTRLPTGAIQDDLPVFQYHPGRRALSAASRSKARSRLGADRRRSTINVDALADYVRATIDSAGPGAAHPAVAAARRDRGAVRAGQRPDRGRTGERPGPDRRIRNADRRLYDGQRLALLPSVRQRTNQSRSSFPPTTSSTSTPAATRASSRISRRSPAAISGSPPASCSEPSAHG